MPGLMQGKRGLVMGVANDHSIAWGIARTLAAHDAKLAFTYQGEALGKRVKPLAASVGGAPTRMLGVWQGSAAETAKELLPQGISIAAAFHNLGAALLTGDTLKTEHDYDMARESVMRVLREHFRPEFLNRVDDVVIFRPLGEEQLTHIVDLRLAELRKLLEPRKITLELTEGARHQLLLTGYDRQYGARPLKRAIQRLIQDPLAIKILDGEVLHGDHIRVDADPLKNRLLFEVEGRTVEA